MKNKPLTNIEWITCIGAIRYFMNRQTIQASMLPYELIEAYWYRWTKEQKKQIVRDLESNERIWKDEAFGDFRIDRPGWLKFRAACDIEKHYEVKLTDGSVHTVFKANDRIYLLNSYIKEPFAETFCEEKSIIQKYDNINLCKRS